MRTKLIVLSLAAALITIGGVAFKANATMGIGTESLLTAAKSYAPIEKASCNGKGLFCQQAPLCSASLYAFACPVPTLRRYGSSVTNIKTEGSFPPSDTGRVIITSTPRRHY